MIRDRLRLRQFASDSSPLSRSKQAVFQPLTTQLGPWAGETAWRLNSVISLRAQRERVSCSFAAGITQLNLTFDSSLSLSAAQLALSGAATTKTKGVAARLCIFFSHTRTVRARMHSWQSRSHRSIAESPGGIRIWSACKLNICTLPPLSAGFSARLSSINVFGGNWACRPVYLTVKAAHGFVKNCEHIFHFSFRWG